MGMSRADNSVKLRWNLPLAIPNQISIISMHIPSLVKIHWCLLKLSSGNENMGVSRADNSIKLWRNLAISNSKPDLHNINAHSKLGENPLMFTQVIIRKRKTDGRMYDGPTEGHKDVQWNHNTPPLSCGGVKKKEENIIWMPHLTWSYAYRKDMTKMLLPFLFSNDRTTWHGNSNKNPWPMKLHI